VAEHQDEQGNTVGPGYVIGPDGDLIFFQSPSAMGYGKKKKKHEPAANVLWEQQADGSPAEKAKNDAERPSSRRCRGGGPV
jgi:hypothetical protein